MAILACRQGQQWQRIDFQVPDPKGHARLVESAVDDIGAGQLCRPHCAEHRVQRLFMSLDGGPDFHGKRCLGQFLGVLSERLAIVVASLDDDREIYALLGPETRGTKQIVARKTLLGGGFLFRDYQIGDGADLLRGEVAGRCQSHPGSIDRGVEPPARYAPAISASAASVRRW